MNPKQFLLVGGIVLLVLGLYGFFLPQTEGSFFWLDSQENWAHLVLGIVALLAYRMMKSMAAQKKLVLLVGILALIASLSGFFLGESFLGANLENPADNVLHLIVAIWAFLAVKGGRAMMGAPKPM